MPQSPSEKSSPSPEGTTKAQVKQSDKQKVQSDKQVQSGGFSFQTLTLLSVLVVATAVVYSGESWTSFSRRSISVNSFVPNCTAPLGDLPNSFQVISREGISGHIIAGRVLTGGDFVMNSKGFVVGANLFTSPKTCAELSNLSPINRNSLVAYGKVEVEGTSSIFLNGGISYGKPSPSLVQGIASGSVQANGGCKAEQFSAEPFDLNCAFKEFTKTADALSKLPATGKCTEFNFNKDNAGAIPLKSCNITFSGTADIEVIKFTQTEFELYFLGFNNKPKNDKVPIVLIVQPDAQGNVVMGDFAGQRPLVIRDFEKFQTQMLWTFGSNVKKVRWSNIRLYGSVLAPTAENELNFLMNMDVGTFIARKITSDTPFTPKPALAVCLNGELAHTCSSAFRISVSFGFILSLALLLFI